MFRPISRRTMLRGVGASLALPWLETMGRAADTAGGNLAEILDNLSYVIRERFKIQRQVRVYTAQGRLTMALLMGMPPIIVTVMLILNPAFIRPLFSDPIGHTLLVAGITLQTVGYFVIRKIIRIQV